MRHSMLKVEVLATNIIYEFCEVSAMHYSRDMKEKVAFEM
jgi:hypothetical protein